MSMPVGHFGLGAGLTTMAVLLAKRQNISVERGEGIGIAGGVWGMLPDAGKLTPVPKVLHNGWWTDLFWLHRFMDTTIDPTDSVWTSASLFAFWLFMLLMLRLIKKSRF